MPDFQTIANVGEIAEGRGRAFVVGDYVVGVYLVDGRYYAINDFCPHMGASLADGELEGPAVTCPLHAWRFDVRDGTWLDAKTIKTESFEVRVVGEEIQVATAPRGKGR